MTNDPMVLGVDLTLTRNTTSTMLNNDSDSGCADLLTEVKTNGVRELKKTRINTLRSLLVEHRNVIDGTDVLELHSCICYVSISMDCTIKASENCQIITIKNINAYNIYTVTVQRGFDREDFTLRIQPNDYVRLSFNETNSTDAYTSRECIYPIGYILYTHSSDNPGDKLGGTWVNIVDSGDSRFLYASSSTPLIKGGSDVVTLESDNIPAHNHNLTVSSHYHDWTNFTDNAYPDDTMRGSNTNKRRFMYRSTANRTSSCDGGVTQQTNTNTAVGNLTSTSLMSFGSGGVLPSIAQNTSNIGGGGSHNNTPQYYTAYCWRRES